MSEENRGRPSTFNQELADKICDELASGKSLRRICSDESMPAESTVRKWALEDREGFYAQYACARDLGMDALAEETIDIADDGRNDTYVDEKGETKVDFETVKRSQLRVAARQWYVERVAPKKYGPRQHIDMNSKVDASVINKTPAEKAADILKGVEDESAGDD